MYPWLAHIKISHETHQLARVRQNPDEGGYLLISFVQSMEYKLTSADKGKKITIKVMGSKLGYQTVSKISNPTLIK